jgi:hypothetical protein
MNSRKLEAAEALVKVADHVPSERVWQTAMAVVLMHEAEPRRFASEASYRVQLGRRVRHLTEANRGRYWNSTEMRFKLVYRDPSPRTAVIIGDMLLTAFGVAGVMFAKQEQAEADAKLVQRQAFYDALHDVTPAAGR